MRLPQVRYFPVALVTAAALLMGCGPTASPGASQPAPTPVILHVNPGTTVYQEQVLTPTAGWVRTGTRLLTTTDSGGNWTDVTPSGSISSLATVFFLNSSQAWAVARSSQVNMAADLVPLVLFTSSDGGRHWSSRPMIATQRLDGEGPVYLIFADEQRGWLVVDQGSHAGFMYFTGFKTVDGGRTWVAASYPQSAPVRFVNSVDGFSGGEEADRGVFVTHDAGQTWASLILPQAPGTTFPAVPQPPVFTSDLDGVLAGEVSDSSGDIPAVAFYTTSDGGRSWRFAASVANPDPRASAITGKVIDGKDWLVALPPQRASGSLPSGVLQLKVSHDSGRTWQWLPTFFSGWVRGFSFRGSTGWAIITEGGCHGIKTDCYSTTGLFETIDFGAHWTQLTVS